MHDCSEISPTEFKETSPQVTAHKDCVKKLRANRSKAISVFCLDPVDSKTMTMGVARIYVGGRGTESAGQLVKHFFLFS